MDESRVAVVVEDDEDIRVAVCALLRESGFTVHAAATGAKGVAAVQQFEPDIMTLGFRTLTVSKYPAGFAALATRASFFSRPGTRSSTSFWASSRVLTTISLSRFVRGSSGPGCQLSCGAGAVPASGRPLPTRRRRALHCLPLQQSRPRFRQLPHPQSSPSCRLLCLRLAIPAPGRKRRPPSLPR